MAKFEVNEDSEMWRTIHEERRQKKIQNSNNSLRILQEHRIVVQAFSDTHFRVGGWDFWPSTGKFYNQKTGRKGRGVFNLIKTIQYEQAQKTKEEQAGRE